MSDTTRNRSNSFAGPFLSLNLQTSNKTFSQETIENQEGCYGRSAARSNSWSSMVLPSFIKKRCPSSSGFIKSPIERQKKEDNEFNDTRQGPLETDLFWLVLHDLSESK